MPLEYIDYCAALNLLDASDWQCYTIQRGKRWLRKTQQHPPYLIFILCSSENGNSATLFKLVRNDSAWEASDQVTPDIPLGWKARVLTQGTLDEVLMSPAFAETYFS